MIESGELESDFSNLYIFLPSVTDENINKYLQNVSASPVDNKKERFDKWTAQEFNHSQLGLYGNHKNK